jgi:iron complex outermembrane receptor protein
MKTPNIFTSNTILSLGIALSIGYGAQAVAQDDDQALQDLLRLLNQQTELVTKTKVNADYVPGALTVLRANELQRYGVRTVKEALSMTPSLEMQHNHLGHTTLVTRGFGTPFSGGTVLLMLDNVNMVSAVTGFPEVILNMPIDQVERIEIIRGAASVLYGGFAYAGVVNVVSRNGASASASVGNFGYRQASVSNVFNTSETGRLALSYSQWQQDKTDTRIQGDPLVYAERDAISAIDQMDTALSGVPSYEAFNLQPGDIAQYSNTPNAIDDRKIYRGFLANWQDNQTKIYFNLQDYRLGDFYGYGEILPNETSDYNQLFEDINLGIEHKLELSSDSRIHFHLNLSQRKFKIKSEYSPSDITPFIEARSIVQALLDGNMLNQGQKEGLAAFEASGLSGFYPFINKRPMVISTTEQTLFSSAELIHDFSDHHRFMMGVQFEALYIPDSSSRDIYAEKNNVERVSGIEELAMMGDKRQTLAVFAQDEWRPDEKLTVTIGLRAQLMQVDYDRLTIQSNDRPDVVVSKESAVDELETWSVLPKIAMVYHSTENHIYKAQYSRGMVTLPTHQLNGKRFNYVSNTDHLEAGYIYNGLLGVQRFTGFYSIYNQAPEGAVYFNYTRAGISERGFEGVKALTDVKSYGIEWDAELSLTSKLNGFVNATLMRTQDDNNKVPLVGSADYMAKLGLDYAASQNWRLTGWLNHVGERHRAPYDAREAKLPAYTLTNVNLNYMGVKKMTISLAVENVFDKDYAFVSAPNRSLSSTQPGLYDAPIAEDYAGMPRQFWFKLRYDF